MLSRTQLEDVLLRGEFAALVGEPESDFLEAKGEPYHCHNDEGKSELAKDVSSLANREGGYLVIGFRTAPDAITQSDHITAVRPFPADQFNTQQYRQIIDAWIYPPLSDVKIRWTPVKDDRGVAIIEVPPQPSEKKLFLITKTVLESRRRRDIFVGLSQRFHDQVQSISVQQLHQLLRDGMLYQENVAKRFDELDAKVQQLIQQPKPALRIDDEMIRRRLSQEISDAGLSESTYLVLSATPNPAIAVKSLLSTRPGTFGALVEDPPQLRQEGFGIWASKQSRLLDGFRRQARIDGPGGRVLTLYRDGHLVFAASDTNYCWAMNKPGHINTVSLVETIYNFCTFVERLLADADQRPENVALWAVFNQAIHDPRWELSPRLSNFGSGLYPSGTPNTLGSPRIEMVTTIPGEGFTASRAAYCVLENIYAHFGWDEDSVPFVSGSDSDRSVDPAQILKLSRR